MNLFRLLFPARLSRVLHPTKRVTLHGIRFTIRKLNPLDYLAGAKSLHQVYNTYEGAKERPKNDFTEKDVEAIKRHYRDTLMSGVVSVRCSGRELEPTRKEVLPGEFKIPVDNLMTDWNLAEELYAAIIQFTYGKKKLKAMLSQNRKLSTST